MPTTERLFRLAPLPALILAACLLLGCSKPTAPETPTAATEKPPPAPASFTTVAGIFPDGPGKELVLSTCGSCHPVACSAIGQRSAERWESLKNGHKDKLTGVTNADLEAMFTYLKATFNESKPEPKVPPEFMQQGCTPF